ncbi:uncharacterized protein PpBr36_11467 [Pyricularia pennisetigena]|uniref:uncharacterized protein n=1 Tax=Pyricularia pennisetigena TaxID=1578925 RepID=UPI00114DC600|nr:uncharacterized protein PpBr36_11467 [Pyricularia pennisetigena]TLS20279.1 hypothetical protein PpBr36_11467 [Pyricularia pennisetigena]
MKSSLFYLTFGLVPAILATPGNPGASGSQRRCGVVPFHSQTEVWMIPSASSGWILPKGKYETKDRSWEACARREAEEEGGFYFDSLEYVGSFGDTVWYKGTVTRKGEPTDQKNRSRGPAAHFTFSEAAGYLTGYGEKKDSMLSALNKALE